MGGCEETRGQSVATCRLGVPRETSALVPYNEEWQLATLSYNIEIP